MRDSNLLITIAAVLGALGVVLGAFGAHALSSRLNEEMLATFETGVRYQLWHTLAMLSTGLLATRVSRRGAGALRAAGWAFAAGIVLFSGSLYAIVFTGITVLGIITPIGGLALIAGWSTLAFASARLQGDGAGG